MFHFLPGQARPGRADLLSDTDADADWDSDSAANSKLLISQLNASSSHSNLNFSHFPNSI